MITSQEVYQSALILLSHDRDGELQKLFQRILEWEKGNPPHNEYHGFEWWTINADPRTLNNLVTRRILRIVLRTNKYCCYRSLDLSAIEKALADYEGSFTQEAVEEEQIPTDLFKIVVGHQDKIDIIMRSLSAERPVSSLLWGSPSSAKSLILEELSRLPQSRFILGSALSRAGLFDVLFNQRPRYLIIDEIEKIQNTEDLAALLSLMERGIVTTTKYRRHQTIRLKTWVFASANSLQNLPRELLSRFLLLRFKDYTPEEFYEVSVNVLSQREGISEHLAIYVAQKVLEELESRDVRDCVKCARLLREHTKIEVDKIVQILRRQR